MDSLIALAILLVLTFPVASIVALALAFGAGSRLRILEQRIATLDAQAGNAFAALAARVHALETRAPPAPQAPSGAPSDAEPSVPAESAPTQSVPDESAAAEPQAAGPSAQGQPLGQGAPAPDEPQAPRAPGPPPDDIGAAPPARGPRPVPPSLEERFGTRWVVWVGGLALALGGIFLVRYSIEEGLLGPSVRIALGAILAALLVGLGEWLRRRENREQRQSGAVGIPTAHIPSILTAAGTTVAYATVFAAYALYDLVGPAPAFVLLGIVALATLGAALLHGPALAALGFVGAEVAPLLVRSERPNYWALYVYLAVVTAAAFALARLRLWRWLAITAAIFGLAWVFPGVDEAGTVAPHLFHAIAGFCLAALLIVAGLYFGPDLRRGRIDAVSSGAIAAYLVAAAAVIVGQDHAAASLVVFAVLVVATVAMAWRSEAAVAALPAAALLVVLVIISWAVAPQLSHLVASGPGNGLAPEPSQSDIALHLGLGAFFLVLFSASGYLAQGRYAGATAPILWAASGVLAPLAILIVLYYRIYGLERSLPFAGFALLLAAWNAVATEQLSRRASGTALPGVAAAAALHAAGSAAALALVMAFALEKGWLTVGLALMAPGIAWVASRRPLPMLRWIVAAVVLLVLARIAWEPRIVGDDIGTTPFFNWLLYGYGVPALAFWGAGHMLRQRADDVPSRVVDAAAILFTVLFAFVEIRHAMNGGDIYAARSGLGELALQVAVGLALAIGLERLRLRTHNIVHDAAALIIAGVTLVAIVFGLFIAQNPLLTDAPVGPAFLNLVLLGYGLPAVLAIVLALVARPTRPMAYRAVAAGTAVVLALAYLTLETMRLYHGPVLSAGAIGDAEQYTFSGVWLAYGVALLLVGVLLRSKPARLASAAVIVLTIAKVFVVDMADLAGIWRALSFIGLGLVLVGIGYLYQRLLFPPAARTAPGVGNQLPDVGSGV